MNKKVILCSACLLGVNCKYNGKNNLNKKVLELARKGVILVQVCPEQLGGLPTPRKRSEQRKRRIITEEGLDVTRNFNRGAKEVLRLAKLLGIKEAILKQRSPSCGSGQIYNGTFSSTVITGDGVTTALLKKHGIKVISEEEL